MRRCAHKRAALERHPALGRAAARRAQVTSNLHRQQLVRAIKRVILGLGAAPGPPRRLRCRPLTCAAVACAWDAPAEPGHPPFHKFKLERLAPGGAGGPAAWATAGGELDGDQRQFVDAGLAEVRRGPGAARRSARRRTPRTMPPVLRKLGCRTRAWPAALARRCRCSGVMWAPGPRARPGAAGPARPVPLQTGSQPAPDAGRARAARRVPVPPGGVERVRLEPGRGVGARVDGRPGSALPDRLRRGFRRARAAGAPAPRGRVAGGRRSGGVGGGGRRGRAAAAAGLGPPGEALRVALRGAASPVKR